MWPKIERVIHIMELIVKERENGGDPSHFSLDYRLGHDHDEVFIDTYKHAIHDIKPHQIYVRNKSLHQQNNQKYESPVKKNFVSRKMHTSVRKRRFDPDDEIVKSRQFEVYYSRDMERPMSKRGKTNQGSRQKKVSPLYDYEDEGLVFKNEFDHDKPDNFVLHDWKISN